MKTKIKNVVVVSKEDLVMSDILIENGIISELGKVDLKDNEADKVVDGEGLFAFPGFIDLHVHLDDKIGDFYLADDYFSGTKRAVENGVTTIFSFITQKQGAALVDEIRLTENKALGNLNCNVGWHVTPVNYTSDCFKEVDKLIEAGCRSFKLYTTYKKSGIYSDYDGIRAFAQRYTGKDIMILVHCEDDKSLKHEYNFKTDGYLGHAYSRPPMAEIMAVKHIIEICRDTNVHFHIVHVSCVESIQLIAKAKAEGVNITCETCPQYLFLTDEKLALENGNYYMCTPPLRNMENVTKLREFAVEGAFDIYTTDHCAFTVKDKDLYKHDIARIPNGLPGVGRLSHLIFKLYDYKEGLKEIYGKLCEEPARLAGIYPQRGVLKQGSSADIVLLNFCDEYYMDNYYYEGGKGVVFDPYEDVSSRLAIEHVFVNGEHVLNKGSFTGINNKGENLWKRLGEMTDTKK